MLIPVPETIEIGPFTYRIVLDPELREEEDVHGQTHYRKLTISLFPDMQTPELKQHTFWHEVVHAIDHANLNKKLTEDDVNAIGNGLHQVMKSLGIQLTFEDLPSR